MAIEDDELVTFAARGAQALPDADSDGVVDHDGAEIWYATYGAGPAVILLHGGLGHSGNWGYQVADLVASGRQVVVIDSRGHGRSTRDDQPFTYELMAADVLAVMDHLEIDKAALVGWSDGACTALILADKHPRAGQRRVLLCLQHGSVRRKAVRADAGDRSLLQPAPDGLHGDIADAGSVRCVCRGCQRDDGDGAELFGGRSQPDQRAGGRGDRRSRRVHQAGACGASGAQHSGCRVHRA
jgi:pimeloyl-ACP methyl ester carboxylesterase